MAKKEPTVEYIATYEYIFRHNRGIFWTLADQLPEHVAMHPLFRFCLGWMCPRRGPESDTSILVRATPFARGPKSLDLGSPDPGRTDFWVIN